MITNHIIPPLRKFQAAELKSNETEPIIQPAEYAHTKIAATINTNPIKISNHLFIVEL